MGKRVTDCLQRLDEEIKTRKYTRHSWTQFVLSGEATREGLRDWAIQKFHQTYLQIPIFSILHSRTDSVEIRLFMVDQLIDEETTIRSGSDSHYRLMRRFAIAMGATEAQVDTSAAGAPVVTYVEDIKNVCATEHPVVALAAMYAGERQTAEVTGLVAKQLRKQFPQLSDHELEWFDVHTGDDEHANAERALIEQFGEHLPTLEDDTLRVTDRFLRSWAKLQDFYYTTTTTAKAGS